MSGGPATRGGPATSDGARVTVVGLDAVHGEPAGERLGPRAQRALAGAVLVAGGARHLAAVDHLVAGDARRAVLRGDLAALDEVAACAGPAVVVASGDPGFFGIVRALAPRVAADDLAVLPGVSSVAGAFAAAGESWDDALVVSAHGRDPRRALNACRRHPKVAVLTEPGFGPRELAAALGDQRVLLVGGDLGGPGDRFGAADAGEAWPDPNVVLVLDPQRAPAAKGWRWPPRPETGGWALPEDAFDHRDGMITKAEVRALVLAWLGPTVGDLVWDVGAGSGSVAVECSRLGAAVVAVERDPAQCARIAANAARHHAPVTVVHGSAPTALAGLPQPDAVFVGGGGADLPAVIATAAARNPRVVVVALAGLERIGPARRALAGAGLAVDGTQLQALRLTPLGDDLRLAATNPVVLLRGLAP